MKTIWKAGLLTVDAQSIYIPKGSKMIAVQIQHDMPCVWFECDSSAPLELKIINIYGTGNPGPRDGDHYIGTYQLHGGDLVFHVYERMAA